MGDILFFQIQFAHLVLILDLSNVYLNNSIVKITELDGRLVYQTRALGGQAIWNGRNYRGERVASGAYLVLVSQDAATNPDGKKERTAAKIFFISQ